MSHCVELFDLVEADYVNGLWRVTVSWAGSRAGLEHILEWVKSWLDRTGDALGGTTRLMGCEEARDIKLSASERPLIAEAAPVMGSYRAEAARNRNVST